MNKKLLVILIVFCAFFSGFFAIKPAEAVANKSVTVKWNPIDNAHHYNIYYRKTGEKTYSNAVRDLSGGSTYYTIGYLESGVGYEYNLAAVNDKGVEFWWSGNRALVGGKKYTATKPKVAKVTKVSNGVVAPKSVSAVTVKWNKVEGAHHYNIYYKEATEANWTHAARDIAGNETEYTIRYLKAGVRYVYHFTAANSQAVEFYGTGIRKLK